MIDITDLEQIPLGSLSDRKLIAPPTLLIRFRRSKNLLAQADIGSVLSSRWQEVPWIMGRDQMEIIKVRPIERFDATEEVFELLVAIAVPRVSDDSRPLVRPDIFIGQQAEPTPGDHWQVHAQVNWREL